MLEMLIIVAILAASLMFCVVVMAWHVQRMARAHEALLDRLMAADWPSYAGYAEHQLAANMPKYWQRMPPLGSDVRKTMYDRIRAEMTERDILNESHQGSLEPSTVAEFH